MEKIAFAVYEEEGKGNRLICAHETNEGKGCYIGVDFEKFDKYSSAKKVELINEMIVAVTMAYEVKKDVDFKKYSRQ